jgi:hypothetical protein
MPRNLLKSFPTAMLRRGLAHVHPVCLAPVAPADPPAGSAPARLAGVTANPVTEPPITLLLIVPEPPAPELVGAEAELVCAA